jgi:hypothetical protein
LEITHAKQHLVGDQGLEAPTVGGLFNHAAHPYQLIT